MKYPEERIQKLVSNYGNYSRRETEALIAKRKVTKNGIVVTLGTKASIADTIKINNKTVKFNLKHDYFLLNKPKGYISSKKDEMGKEVISLIHKETDRNLFTIGRLDVNTTGLIIVTNDGHLSNLVNKPNSSIKKTYLVWTKSMLSKTDIIQFRKGIKLEDGYITKPVQKVKIIRNTEESSCFKISIIEGKNNQIKKMFKALHHEVINLKRVQIGNIRIDNIESGRYKKISKNEVYGKLNLDI